MGAVHEHHAVRRQDHVPRVRQRSRRRAATPAPAENVQRHGTGRAQEEKEESRIGRQSTERRGRTEGDLGWPLAGLAGSLVRWVICFLREEGYTRGGGERQEPDGNVFGKGMVVGVRTSSALRSTSR